MKLILSYFGPAILAACAAALVLGARAAGAQDSGACYTISDSDLRQVCRARANKDPGMCYAVQRQDLRAQCLAEVRR